jgi:hypothetical protein
VHELTTQEPPAQAFRRGDWREAAANIQEELAVALNARAARVASG